MKTLIALFLLLVYTVVSLCAYLPQIIKLIKTKSSNDLSLSAWLLWILSYLCYLGYVLLESPNIGIVFVSCVELFFTVAVCFLILIYRKPAKRRKK